ncbi:MAG: hypothetical protein CVV33_04130, partial [Methanomicrobiales archaeon HGW-Methanomicrobiales-4]
LLDAAEKKIVSSQPIHPGLKEQTPEQLIHELQVHQIELEIQADELRAAHLALEESRDQYFDLYEFAPLGYLTLTHTAMISQANLTAAGLLGVERTNLINRRFRRWITARDLPIWDQYFINLLKSDTKRTTTLMLIRGDGGLFPARLEGIFRTDINGERVIRVAISDISEIRTAENALLKSENELHRALELLEAITTGTDVIIAAQDPDSRYTFFTQSYKEEIKRLTGKDLTLGSSMIEMFRDTEGKLPVAVDEWNRIMQGENVNKHIEFRDSDKSRRVYQVLHTPIRDAQGTIVGAGEVAYDVTRQTLLDEKLCETKEYLDNLITYANIPILVWDPEFHITLFNHAVELLTGWKEEEVLGKPFSILIPDSHMEPAMDLIRTTMKGSRWDSVEIPILHKNGEIRTVIWNSSTILGAEGGTIVSTIAQGQDITKQRQIETEYKLKALEYEALNETLTEEIIKRNLSDTTLKKTLSLLNASLESTADGIFVVDQQDKITSYNQNFVTMWNIPQYLLESGEKQMVMNHVLPQLKNPEDFLANIDDNLSHPGSESYDMIGFKDGRIFERYSKSQNIGNTVVGRVWSIRDITDRKHAEEKLVGSIQEKEVLLREIHHRVKNNLQLISGLLDMTRMRTVDISTNNILTDMMLKIQTMAQIHTRLFESKQFGKISIPDQIRDQIAALSNIYSHKGHDISCEIHSEEVFLPVDQALPCSLAVNEILSNAYKHAFKGRTIGTIDITVLEEGGHIKITIHDDGIGIPDDLDISVSNSLGIKLIRTLVQHQLKGSFEMNNDCGTKITIDFPIVLEET